MSAAGEQRSFLPAGMHHRHELLPGQWIVAETSKHSACHQVGSMNVNAPT